MPSSFVNLKVHVVFGTKLRQPWITSALEDDLYRYIGGIVTARRCVLEAIGGMPDHVHLLLSLRADVAVAEIVRLIKANSSKWINDSRRLPDVFGWQAGYAAFSVSTSQVAVVREYLRHQKDHHRERTFDQEMQTLLHRHGLGPTPDSLRFASDSSC